MGSANTMATENIPVRILVVDDERIIADTLVRILAGRGYDSRAVYSGEDAAECAIEWKPDHVITDVVMEKMDGIVLAIYLARELPACRVLLMSGHIGTEELLAAAKKLGHEFPILAKPFHPERVFEFLAVSAT